MFDAPLTLLEYGMPEEVSLSEIFREVFAFFNGRKDIAVFGAQAVNVYVQPPRMTEDIDVMATGDASNLAEAIRQRIFDKFHVAVRVRKIKDGAFRVYRPRKPKPQHLVDVRQVNELPETKLVSGVQVVTPVVLLALKIIGFTNRQGEVKSFTDKADLHRLLLEYPNLREKNGLVKKKLAQMGADDRAKAMWDLFVDEKVVNGKDEGW